MSYKHRPKTGNVLSTTLLGILAFLISGVLACIVILYLDNYILATIIAGGVGGLLLGLFLRMHRKLGKITIASLIGMPIGLIVSFAVIEGLGALVPSMGTYFENSSIPDISAIVLLGIVFGVIVGLVLYGRKAVLLFAIVCGVVAIPFGLIVGVLNSESSLKVRLDALLSEIGNIDLNFLSMCIGLGVGVGLSIGLYNMRSRRKAM